MIVLPEIKYDTAIVAKNTGRPTPQFLRFFNIDFRGAVLKQDQAQQVIIDALAAQLVLIQEALDLAGLALATAQTNSGGKVAALTSLPGAGSASTPALTVDAPYLEASAILTGGTLDADAAWLGTASLIEDNGVTSNVLATQAVQSESNHLALPGPAWGAEDSSPLTFEGWGTLSGDVTYTVEFVRDSGSNYAAGASIAGTISVTPKAS